MRNQDPFRKGAMMKLDMTQQLVGLDGQGLEANGEPITLRRVCCQALTAVFPDEQNLEGEAKVKRYELARRIYGDDAVELPAEDVVMLKRLVAKMYGPLIVGQAWRMLDPGV